jgi:hypothetical protein
LMKKLLSSSKSFAKIEKALILQIMMQKKTVLFPQGTSP